ncbi:hypothetical protein H6G81_03225 [Scytonema hofmannii FACHB-248]|uniref:C2H2-type domain-containing protein n=1 Tax=Scytonema hofmannii FACHB-248 TaxID=1842502 RepID=A0ABR8GK89_9CYAN|nr:MULTISPECIES: hypothetical protein [Nostocales]MBD2603565.1 hypothetical protein [Scytonema hofmannii FACHB-248]
MYRTPEQLAHLLSVPPSLQINADILKAVCKSCSVNLSDRGLLYHVRSNSHNKRTPPQPGPLAGGVLHELWVSYRT